jgi:putative SOS response-associated peptidase YedK
MPVILAREGWQRWLGTPEDRNSLPRPFPPERMECWRVGNAVGDVRNEGAQLIERIAA